MSQNPLKKQQSSSSAIKVFIRVRPMVQAQKDSTQMVQIQSDSKTLKIYHDEINHIQSKFDKVFGKKSLQQEIFSDFQPFVKKLFDGFNLTIFAYGQTGSGKTFTMFGSDWQNFVDNMITTKKQAINFNVDESMQKAGIIPRSINEVFKSHEKSKGRFQLFCSFLQIYNEKIYDLLQDSPIPKPLNIHESKVNGIFVEGLTEFQVQTFGDCLKLMRQGEKNRFVRETTMNAKSSRSHTIFQILVQSTISDSNGNYIKARLNLCDLAGSEKIHKGENLQNEHLQQLKNINLSLTTLGKVINSLSSGKKAAVAAFRQSKLTRLLQESLTINTNTFIIGNISPSSKNLDETINTLKFGERASHVTMKIKPIQFNQMNPDAVSQLKKQIQYLKGLLDSKKQGTSHVDQKNDKKINQKVKMKTEQQLMPQKQFQKLLIENRKMKKQIYELQNNLQKVKYENSSMNSSNYRQNSAFSGHHPTQSQVSTHKSLRKQIYLEKFLKKVPESQNKRESRNNSVFVSAGKATIESNQIDKDIAKIKLQQNKQEKLSILKKFQQMQNGKKQNQKMILEELQSLKNINPNDKKGLFGSNAKKQQIPRRYHEANVFRRGKMSLQLGQIDKNYEKKINQGILSKKKVDYSQKIKQLQQRLFNK